MNLKFHPEADDDAIDAVLWYNEQRDGLGDEFMNAVDAFVTHLADKLVHRALLGYVAAGVKVAQMHRFPYRLLYCFQDDTVVIFAVAHGRRQPDYRAHRLSR